MVRRVIAREPLEHNLIVNIPPGESKSSIMIKFLIPWAWQLDPTLRFIVGTNSSDLANDLVGKARDIIASEQYQACFGDTYQIRKNHDNKGGYKTDKGGEVYTATPRSKMIGIHAHMILVDDPQTREMVNSEPERTGSNEWLTQTLSTRKVNKAITPTALIMQRLHEEDATHAALNAWTDLKHIRLPATDEYAINPPELAEHYTEEGGVRVLNPLLNPLKQIRRLEKTLSPVAASGQLGQDPKPAAGNKIRGAWLARRFEMGDLLDLYQVDEKPVWNFVIDSAVTKNKKGSATAILAYTVRDHTLYLRNYTEIFEDFIDLIDPIKRFVYENGYTRESMVFIEASTPGIPLVGQLRKETNLNVEGKKVGNSEGRAWSKEMRVDAVIPFIRSMRVSMNQAIDWEPFIYQAKIFPNGAHDDMVDTLVMAIERIDDTWTMIDEGAFGEM